MSPFEIWLVTVGITILAGVVALSIAVQARRESRRISSALNEIYSRLEVELEQARQDYLEAQQKIQQLEEERPEKLEWELQHATEELERWRQAHSEIQQQLGQQKQEWLHQAEQQEQQRLHLEQERQHLMEELERWRGRYVEAHEHLERLKRARSEDQRKVEQLTQLRERLFEELRGIGKGLEK